MIHNPFIPGTFWQLNSGRYLINQACRFVHADGPHAGEIAAAVPDTSDYIQLHLDTLPGGRSRG